MQIVKNTTILYEPIVDLCNRFWLARSDQEQAFFDLFTYFIYKFPYSADYFLTLHYI